MVTYRSVQAVELYQHSPIPFQPTRFKPRSWTDTHESYLNNANELARCLLKNKNLMRREYTLAVSINIRAVLPVAKIKVLWQKVTRKLREKGIVGLWVREPSRQNHCNYHLIVATKITESEMRAVMEEVMPDRKMVPWHKQVREIRNQYRYAHYICKSKIAGMNKAGKLVADLHRDKRLLFNPKIGLDKFGTIGEFWVKPKKTLWAEIRAVEERIAVGLKKPGVRQLAKHVHEMFGEEIALSRIERSFGFWADRPHIQAWIAGLMSEAGGGDCIASAARL